MCEFCGTSGVCGVCGWDQGDALTQGERRKDVVEWIGDVDRPLPSVVLSDIYADLAADADRLDSEADPVHELAERVEIDARYALKQLRSSLGAGGLLTMGDYVSRAIDALERVVGVCEGVRA